jgi:hypothetical protein
MALLLKILSMKNLLADNNRASQATQLPKSLRGTLLCHFIKLKQPGDEKIVFGRVLLNHTLEGYFAHP